MESRHLCFNIILPCIKVYLLIVEKKALLQFFIGQMCYTSEYMKYIFLNGGERNEVMTGHRSYAHNLRSSEIKA